MRDFKELDGCYILNVATSINSIIKLPLKDFYRDGYWISAVFGDKCYMVRPVCNWQNFTCRMRICQLTPAGLAFIEKYAEEKAKKHKKYLDGKSYIREKKNEKHGL